MSTGLLLAAGIVFAMCALGAIQMIDKDPVTQTGPRTG